jgi:alpha-beta hydrolase superfamily lysophospholipase
VQQLLFAYQQAGLREVSHRFYPGARHESLNDTNRAEVIADLLGWLSRKLPA